MNPAARMIDNVLAFLDGWLERWSSTRFRDLPVAAFMLSPALLVLGVFGVAPLLYALYMSLFERKGIFLKFAWLGNYTKALGSSEFWDSFWITIYYAIGTIPVTMALSFLVASALFRIVRGRSTFRTIYFLPYITSVVAAATVWSFILNPQFGFINSLLQWIGMGETRWSQWLLEPRGVLHLATNGLIGQSVGPSLALCCVILFEVWHSSGFMIVIILAGLSAIPRELEESAKIDGANWFQATWRITIPLLSPTLFFLLIISAIRAFQAFNSFYALTGDGKGPVGRTENLTVYIFDCFFVNNQLEYGAAVAVLLSLAIVALTVLQWRFVGRKVHYD